MLDISPKQGPARGVVMMLHGWGSTSRDVELLAEALRMPNFRYLIPEGRVEIPGTGGVGKGWYSLPFDENSARERTESRNRLFRIVTDLEKADTPANNIILMGFSQGGSMSLDVALNYHTPVAGVVSLSGFLLDAEEIKERKNLHTSVPIFAAHGTLDLMIPIEQGKSTIVSLRDVGFNVEWHEYEADHRVVMEEIEDVREFLSRLFPA